MAQNLVLKLHMQPKGITRTNAQMGTLNRTMARTGSRMATIRNMAGTTGVVMNRMGRRSVGVFAKMGFAIRGVMGAFYDFQVASAAFGLIGFGITKVFYGMAKTAIRAENAFVDLRASLIAGKYKEISKKIKSLREDIKDLAGTTLYTNIQLAKAAKELLKRGTDFKDMGTTLRATVGLGIIEGTKNLSGFAGRLAQTFKIMKTQGLIGSMSMTTLAAKISVASKRATTSVEGIAQALSYFGPELRTSGLDPNQTISFVSILSNIGMESGRAGTALRRLQARILKLAGGKGLGKLTKLTGISGKKLKEMFFVKGKNSLKNLKDVMFALSDLMNIAEKRGKGTFKAEKFLQWVMGLRGKSAARAVIALRKEFETFSARIAGTKAVDLWKAVAARQQNVADQFKILKAAWEQLSITMFTPFLGKGLKNIKGFTSILRQSSATLEAMWEGKSLTDVVWDKKTGATVNKNVINFWKGFVAGAKEAAGFLGAMYKKYLAPLLDKMKGKSAAEKIGRLISRIAVAGPILLAVGGALMAMALAFGALGGMASGLAKLFGIFKIFGGGGFLLGAGKAVLLITAMKALSAATGYSGLELLKSFSDLMFSSAHSFVRSVIEALGMPVPRWLKSEPRRKTVPRGTPPKRDYWGEVTEELERKPWKPVAITGGLLALLAKMIKRSARLSEIKAILKTFPRLETVLGEKVGKGFFDRVKTRIVPQTAPISEPLPTVRGRIAPRFLSNKTVEKLWELKHKTVKSPRGGKIPWLTAIGALLSLSEQLNIEAKKIGPRHSFEKVVLNAVSQFFTAGAYKPYQHKRLFTRTIPREDLGPSGIEGGITKVGVRAPTMITDKPTSTVALDLATIEALGKLMGQMLNLEISLDGETIVKKIEKIIGIHGRKGGSKNTPKLP